MIGRIIVAGFVAVVILAECLLAYFLIPSADAVATAAKAKIAEEKKEQEEKEEGDGSATEQKSAVEVELGRFNITLHQHTASTTMHISFVLVGTVKEEEREEFDRLLANNQHRFRDKILLEIRNSELSDLTEPGLGLIKRRILEKSNVLFGKPLLISVLFSEFSFHEQ